ncbi:ABC transporter ATP-binding protein [Promicromonospora vindobonensis]|uniref:ABC transporter ATP-binding protein n=1 Tax=Promicromonospora vindobonensis TaxID=195748 RepID=A0ABW5W1N5_9MICO
MSTSSPVLAARGLTKHFRAGHFRAGGRRVNGRPPARAIHAVDGVDLELHRGQVLAVVGESGSGKSTVARLLAQLIPFTGGQVLLDGVDARVRGRRAFRAYAQRVQMIFQDPFASLNPVHPVRYTLTRALRLHRRHPTGGTLRGAELEAALTELLERVHLTPAERYVDSYPHELSGGQRQRIAIARALAADPEVLLADEPVSMLDVSIRLGILNLLADLRDRLGIAILYITHDIASARYFADRTTVLYAGQVMETGDSESVTQEPLHPYTRLLVASAPDPDDLAGAGAAAVRDQGTGGEPPSLVDPPPGCRFAPRCPYARDLCRSETPALIEVAPGRSAACWGYSDRDDRPDVGVPTGSATSAGEAAA